MTGMRILFSNQPLAYREAMAAAVQMLRPATEVTVGDPHDLDAEIDRLQPQLVVCNGLTDSVRHRALAWVVLYPDGQSLVTCNIAGREHHSAGIDLSGLLWVVDEVTRHSRTETTLDTSPTMGDGIGP
jgi:hypothetical protein